VRLIVGCTAVCWGPVRSGPFGERQIRALDRAHKNAAEFANPTNDWNGEMVAQRSVLSVAERTAENWLGRLW
jgi:hypothetical protein